MLDVFAGFLLLRRTCKRLHDYSMNQLDHSSVVTQIFRLYYTDIIWAQLPMRRCKGAHSRNPAKRKDNSFPVFNHPRCQSCVNFAETCLKSIKMIAESKKTDQFDNRIHVCQFCQFKRHR